MPGGDGQSSNCGDMSRQTELQLSTCEIPNLPSLGHQLSLLPPAHRGTHLDHPIAGPCREPLVPRLHCNGPYPPQVPADDTKQLPLRVVVGLDGAGFASADEGVGEEGGGGVRGGEGGKGGGAARIGVRKEGGSGRESVREFLDRLAGCGLGTCEERSQLVLEGVT